MSGPQLPAICIRGWVIEPLTTLDTLKVCGKDDWLKPEYLLLKNFTISWPLSFEAMFSYS